MELLTASTTFNFARKFLPSLFNSLKKFKNQRHHELDEIADVFGDPTELAKYYIEPDCQQFNPADYEDESSHVVTEPIFSRIQKYFNAPCISGGNQLFILADSGMGKTSALVMLRLAHINSFWPEKYDCVLLKIGEETIDKICHIKSKRKTILLLDALDEDPSIWGRTIPRLTELLSATKNFYRVIITCRTQFFSGGDDPLNRRGQVEVCNYICPTIYLSLFNDEQVSEYCQKRFPYSTEMISKSKKILSHMMSLRLRPMLLAHIEDIIQSDQHEWNIYTLYDALITTWLHREVRKMAEFRPNPPSVETLRVACKKYAVKLSKIGQRSLKAIEFHGFIQQENIAKNIETMEIGGRSLINMNSDGEFRFSHYTVQEFLLADSIIKGEVQEKSKKIHSTNQVVDFIVSFLSSNPNIRHNISLSMLEMNGLNLENQNLSYLKITDGLLENAILRNSNLESTNLSGSNLRGADFTGSNLKDVNFEGADLSNADLTGSDFTLLNISEALLTGANLSGVKLTGLNLAGKNMERVILKQADLSGANLSGSNLRGADFTGSNLKDVNFEGADLSNADLTGSDFTLLNISEVLLTGANLSGVKLTGLNLAGKNMERVILKQADLSGANLAETNLLGADLSNTNLSGANFSRSDLTGSNFKSSNITNTNFENAKIFRTNFKNARPYETAENLKKLDTSGILY
jgi:uncharacterized protein YjbI with pentapeptide repeats